MYASDHLYNTLQDIHHCLTQFQKFGFAFEARSLANPFEHTITDHLMSSLLTTVNLPEVSQTYTGKTKLWTNLDSKPNSSTPDVADQSTPLSFNATLVPLGTSRLGTLRFSAIKPLAHSESTLHEFTEKLEFITIERDQGYSRYLAHGKAIAYELDDGSWIIYNIAEVYRTALCLVCPTGFALERADTLRVFTEQVTTTLIKELLLESWCQVNYTMSQAVFF